MKMGISFKSLTSWYFRLAPSVIINLEEKLNLAFADMSPCITSLNVRPERPLKKLVKSSIMNIYT
jgi:hypothetical protein